MTDTYVTIDRAGPESTDWKLVQRDNNLEMLKTIPYDGVRVFSTEKRTYVSYRKSSRFNLSVERVLELYEAKTGRTVERCRMCNEWPVGAADTETTYLTSRFCSPACEVRHDDLQADAPEVAR